MSVKGNTVGQFVLIIAISFCATGIFAQEVTSSGAFSYTYPLDLPAGRNGIGPQLSLVYNSNTGNGMLGVGWSLSGLSIITRDSSYPITFFNTGISADHFLLDGQKLVLGADGKYHTEKESYVTIEFVDPDITTAHWIVTLKNGTKMFYGHDDADHDETNDGNVTAINRNSKALVWCLSRVEDVLGNYYVIEYNEDTVNGDYYPTKIVWTKHVNEQTTKFHSVEFSYEHRSSAEINKVYVPSAFTMDLRMKYIAVRTGVNGNSENVRLYAIYYAIPHYTYRSLISSMREYGSNAIPPGSFILDEGYWPGPAAVVRDDTKFEWSGSEFGLEAETESSFSDLESDSARFSTFDFDGDNRTDIIHFYEIPYKWKCKIYKSTGSSYELIVNDQELCITDPNDYRDNFIFYPADVNGDGKSDIIITYTYSGLYYYQIMLSNGTSFNSVSGGRLFDNDMPYYMLSGFSFYPADINGDGKSDFIATFKDGNMLYYLKTWVSNGSTFNAVPGAKYHVLCDGSGRGGFKFFSADINGDGKSDFFTTYYQADSKECICLSWLSNGEIFIPAGFVDAGYFHILGEYTGKTESKFFPIDFNGDGKADLLWTFLYEGKPYYKIVISNGRSFEALPGASYHLLYIEGSMPQFYPVEINGDNKTDLLTIFEHDGNWMYKTSIANVELFATTEPDDYLTTYDTDYDTNFFPIEIDGDGKSDVVILKTNSSMMIMNYTMTHRTYHAGSPDQLKKIKKPSGGSIDIEYKPAPQVPGAIDPTKTDLLANKIAAANPQSLVTSITYNDGFAHAVKTNYEYSNHLVYRGVSGFPYERADLGFEWIKKIDANTGSVSNGAYTKTWYFQDVPYEGLVKKVVTYDKYDKLYTETEYTYFNRTDVATGNSDVKFVYRTSEITRNYNGNWFLGLVKYRTVYDPNPDEPSAANCWYDEHGNLTRVDSDGDISVPGDETSVVTTWIHNTAGMAHATQKITKYAKSLDAPTGPLAIASEQRFWFDDQSYGVVTNGLVTKKEIENGSDDITLTYGYDSATGNLLWFKDGKANAATPTYVTASYTYDTQYGTYPVTTTNAAGMTTTTAYDNLMRPVSVTDINGQVWSTVYDEFGRIKKSIAPGDTIGVLTIVYYYNDTIEKDGSGIISRPKSVISEQKRSGLIDWIMSFTYYDGLGRTIQTKIQPNPEVSEYKTVDYYFDQSGRQNKTSVPYIATIGVYSSPDIAQKSVVTSYDSIGRPITTTNTDGTQSNIVYETNRIVVIDEKGNATSKQIRGNICIEKSYNDPTGDYSPTNYPSEPPSYFDIPAYYTVTTTTAWNGVRIEDSGTGTSQATVSTVCNMLGLKTSYTDKNMGTWTYAYDKNGNLVTQTDAKGQTLEFVYDKLNRIKMKKNGATVLAWYMYGDELDPVPQNSRGRLVSVTGPFGGEYYAYDERGRVSSIGIVLSSLDPNPRFYAYEYNTANQLVKETYPTGEVLTYYYGVSGQIEKISGTKAGAFENFEYAKDIGYTTLDKLKQITYHNNVTTMYDYFDSDEEQDQSNGNRTYSYRLRNIHVQKAGALLLGDTTYEYDAVDNIVKKTFTDGYKGRYAETFAYDDLNRLVSADGSVIPDKPIYGFKQFEYLPNNNIAEKDDRIYAYNATVVRDGQTVTLPHAVSKIMDEAWNTLYAYEYDKNGNRTNAVGGSTITIRAKKNAGSVIPRMELWLDGKQCQAWLVDNDEYHDYTWSGRLDNAGTIDVIYVNGDEAADLFVEHVTVNGTMILTTDTTKVVFDPGEYYGGCVDNINITGGSVPLTQTGGLRFSTNGIAHPVLNRTITYDVENRVASITESGNTSTFAYDYTGTRIKKTETFNGVTTTTYYFGDKFEVTNTSGQPTKQISYYFANSQRIAQRTDDGTTSEVLYYHTDHLGSAVRLTNEAGEPVQSIVYAPFGETVFASGTKGPKYQFTGQEIDTASGLYYYGARYYCPEIGRFIQPDPLLDGLNKYAYCWNNPLVYTDPDGRNPHYTNGDQIVGENGDVTTIYYTTAYNNGPTYGYSVTVYANNKGGGKSSGNGSEIDDSNIGITSDDGVGGMEIASDTPVLQPPPGINLLPYVGNIETESQFVSSLAAGAGNIWNFIAGVVNNVPVAIGDVAQGIDTLGSAITKPTIGLSLGETVIATSPLGAECNAVLVSLRSIRLMGASNTIKATLKIGNVIDDAAGVGKFKSATANQLYKAVENLKAQGMSEKAAVQYINEMNARFGNNVPTLERINTLKSTMLKSKDIVDNIIDEIPDVLNR